MARMTATEVARSFSAVLNRVLAGEEIEIVRNGATVARLTPPERARLLSAELFRELVASLPPVDDDFVSDLEDIRREVGVHRDRGPQQTRRRAVVEAILAAFDAIPVTEPVARIHAEIWDGLSARGSVIGNHDLWIAATAISHGFGVATRNARDFERVAGLRVLGFAP